MKVLVITTVFTCLAALFVAIRLWIRFRLVKSPGFDDLLIIAALLCAITFYATILVERRYGLGVDKSELPENVIHEQMRYLWLSIPLYNLSLILSKLSALVFYLRIFQNRAFRIATYITMGTLIASGLWMVVSGFVFCIPVSDFWSVNRTSRTQNCLPEGPVWYSNAAIQILTDIIILLLPMPLLSSLHLPRNQKAGIIVVFCIGIFVIATSSARLHELSTMLRGHDFTNANAEAAVWSCLENTVSIICACLPPLYPLISRIFSFCFRPRPLHSSRYPYSGNTTQLTSAHHYHLSSSSRKPSVYDHTVGSDGAVFYNDLFYCAPGSYSASVAMMDPNHVNEDHQLQTEEGIRVVRELRLESDSADPVFSPHDMKEGGDLEMGKPSSGSGGDKPSNPTAIEGGDLGDFEFPDYKKRMNCPIY